MLILDTNIYAELIKPHAQIHVLKQFERNQYQLGLAITVWHELQLGLMNMPDGKKKQLIAQFLETVVRCAPLLNYGAKEATIHAEIRAQCRRNGKTLAFADSQIAAITISNNATLVTRNTLDYQDIDQLNFINWFNNTE